MKDVFSKEEKDLISGLKSACIDRYYISNLPYPPKEDQVIVAGGFFASSLTGEMVHDFDIFVLQGFPAIEEHIARNREKFTEKSSTKYFSNPHIFRVVNDNTRNNQIIFCDYKNRRELIDHFDYVHCQTSYDVGIDKLFISPETFKCITSKILKATPSQGFTCEGRRQKFLKRGFKEDPFTVQVIQDSINSGGIANPYDYSMTDPNFSHHYLKFKQLDKSVIDDILSDISDV